MKSKIIKLAITGLFIFIALFSVKVNAKTKKTKHILKINPASELILSKRLCNFFDQKMTVEEIYPIVYQWIGVYDQGVINDLAKAQSSLNQISQTLYNSGSSTNLYTSFLIDVNKLHLQLLEIEILRIKDRKYELAQQFIEKHARKCFKSKSSSTL